MSWSKKHIDRIDKEMHGHQQNGHGHHHSTPEDEALTAARRDIRLLQSALQLDQYKKNKQFLDRHRAALAAQNHGGRRSRRRFLFALPAVAAAVLALVFFLPGGGHAVAEPQNPYLAEHFEEFLLHEGWRNRQREPERTAETVLYDMFALKEFNQAIPLLEQSWTTQDDTMALYYLILSHAALGDDRTARQLFASHRDVLTREMTDQLERMY
ncbi:MAG: hypothetical protein R3301_11230 [Saprospiraceae bacterium]|nr:hypothetical protein [Saprospiraceae bacterium]